VDLIDRILLQLRGEQEERGKVALFDRVRGFLVFDPPDATYAELAAEFPDPDPKATLAARANALKTWVSRLGTRYRELLRDAVADTVETPDDVDDELRYLAACLSLGQ
jgi:RNA polymerase sigma-70 factor (ECF subfamily)